MGFTSKQIIHPAQITIVQKAFSPSKAGMPLFCWSVVAAADLLLVEIDKAKQILQQYEEAVKGGKGAYGLNGEMMDAPMVLQAQRVLKTAKQFQLA